MLYFIVSWKNAKKIALILEAIVRSRVHEVVKITVVISVVQQHGMAVARLLTVKETALCPRSGHKYLCDLACHNSMEHGVSSFHTYA